MILPSDYGSFPHSLLSTSKYMVEAKLEGKMGHETTMLATKNQTHCDTPSIRTASPEAGLLW